MRRAVLQNEKKRSHETYRGRYSFTTFGAMGNLLWDGVSFWTWEFSIMKELRENCFSIMSGPRVAFVFE